MHKDDQNKGKNEQGLSKQRKKLNKDYKNEGNNAQGLSKQRKE